MRTQLSQHKMYPAQKINGKIVPIWGIEPEFKDKKTAPLGAAVMHHIRQPISWIF